MNARSRAMATAAVVVAALGGCGRDGGPPSTTPTPGARPSRPALPCDYPDDIAALDAMRRGSDAVVVARVVARTGTPEAVPSVDAANAQLVRWPLAVEQVLSGTAPDSIEVVESVSSRTEFFRDDRYVLFLYARDGSRFTVLNGVEGMLPIRNDRVFKECYGSGTERVVATGERSGESLTDFVARFRAHQPTAGTTPQADTTTSS